MVRQNLAKNSENINFRPLGIFSLRIFHPDFSPWHVYLSNMWSDKTLQKTVKTQTSGHLVFFTFFILFFHPGMCIFHPRQYVVRQNLAKNSENINFRPLGSIFHPDFSTWHVYFLPLAICGQTKPCKKH